MIMKSMAGAKTAWIARQVGAKGAKERGTLLVFTHANGFCKEMWLPIWDLLIEQIDTERAPIDLLSLDLAGHGDSGPITKPLNIEEFGRNVLEAIDTFCARTQASYDRIVGIGHSIGGSSTLKAQLLRPVFTRVLLMEPIMSLPDEQGRFFRKDESDFVKSTLRRRNRFPDRKSAADNWRGKGAYKGWAPGMLELFVQHAMRETEDGSVELKCEPASEAEAYADNNPILTELHKVSCPAIVIGGSESWHMPKDKVEAFHKLYRYPGGFEIVPGGDHFLPMVDPEFFTKRILETFSFPTKASTRLAPKVARL
ncbi:Hypothetical Protein FCC1311_065672 [Hondaea fermentalgiana]|uniref:AB hydrolase-1 domain-containing protein n=1 Tax=Hondaea fermentalgiana TaxID=2315210 RepID=A0A2R5GKU0_9STRA|nr:Hypothetical Protein FCC1311_065672 [Hondaea fermentalgiana]|eukprot:GBG30348.1 Hypothetical Protein FCC1311_065672 [Hondaea fermentalgiana]